MNPGFRALNPPLYLTIHDVHAARCPTGDRLVMGHDDQCQTVSVQGLKEIQDLG